MALADRWLLPDGVKEILPPDAQHIERLRRELLDLFATWGYDFVMPPLIEYLDSLLTGTGNDLALNTFKLTDQLTGHLLGVRADTTPQVARIDAHCLRHEAPTRLCYANSVLHTQAAHMLASRSPLQLGAELYGHAGIESDIEVISLMLETLSTAGVDSHMTLDLGHVGLYRNLVQAAGMSEADEGLLFEMLQRKALTEIDSFVTGLDIAESLCRALQALPRLNGGAGVLVEARRLCAGAPGGFMEAIDDLDRIVTVLTTRYPDLDVYVDLSELRGYRYHTGIVFAAYVPTYGQAIAKGGRYDEIGRVFGRARAATGFSADLKVLAQLAPRPAAGPGGILAPAEDDPRLRERIAELRRQGERVVQALPGQVVDYHAMGCDRHLVREQEGWAVQPA